MISFAILGSAFVFCYAILSMLIVLAPRIGLVDHPGGRKQHRKQTPLVGGLAIATTLLFALVILRPTGAVPMIIAASILLVVGIADDLVEVSPLPKFILQAGACLVMYFMAHVELRTVGNLVGMGSIGLWWFSVPMTIVAVIGVINAINMADGMDGHAGVVGAIAFAAFAIVARASGLWDQYHVLLILLGATCAFLMMNFRSPFLSEARTFLGDTGSMLLGLMVGWFAIDLTQGPGRTFPAICALWIVILPLCDCVSLMIRRKRAKGSMFVADRQHLHHYLLNRGLSVSQASYVAALLHVACAAVGILAWLIRVPEWIMFVAFVVLFVAYHVNMTNVFKSMPQGGPKAASGPDAEPFTQTR